MIGRLYEKRMWRIACFGLLVFGLAMVGCNGGNGQAQAQTEWQITTFRIEPDSFVIRAATSQPTTQVVDGTTIYTIVVDNTIVEYTLTGPGGGFIPASPRTLLAGDQVIERSITSTLVYLTLIRQI